MIAIKLSPEQVNSRVRKARKNRDKRITYSKEYYQLLNYIIFITNVDEKVWDYKQVAQAYRVRWNIEILFKSWKSGFHIQDMLPEARKHTERVESVLYLMLIYITWFQILIYIPLRWDKKTFGKQLSILKLATLVNSNLITYLTDTIDLKTKKEIVYHCCYDKRLDRLNASERLEKFFLPLS